MSQPEKVVSKEFVALNGIMFLAFCNMAVFFQFYQYLHTLPIDHKWFGLLISIFSLTSLIVRPFISPLLHPGNGRRWMLIGSGLTISSLLAYNLACGFWGMALVRVFHGLGHVFLVTALMATFVAYIPKDKSGQAFSISMNVNLLPYALLPPLIGGISLALGGFVRVLDLLALIMLLCFPPLLALIKSPLPATPDNKTDTHAQIGYREMYNNLKDRRILLLLLVYLLIYMGFAPVFFFIKTFASSQGIAAPGLFFTIVIFSMIIVRVTAMPLFDKCNKLTLFILSLSVITIAYPLLAHSSSPAVFYALAVPFGIGWGFAVPLGNALMFEISPPRLRGLNINLLFEMQQGGFFMGPLLGGFIVAGWGYQTLFYVCGAFGLAGILMTILIKPKDK